MSQRPRRPGSSSGRPGSTRGYRAGRPQKYGRPGGGGPQPPERSPDFREPKANPASIPHLAPTGQLAERAVEAADAALKAVLVDHTTPVWSLDTFRLAHRQAPWSWLDAWFVDSAIRSLFRWWGWIAPIEGMSTAERLMLASLMDAHQVHPVVRQWARMADRNLSGLMTLGDAPTWTAKTDGFKRLVAPRTPVVDPWRLFPAWFREAVELPPGPETPKVRGVRLIEALQQPSPLWLRCQGGEPEVIWNELRDLGLKPWVHRKVGTAARLETELDLEQIPAYMHGRLERQDLSAQAIAPACAPLPGQRWWVTHAGAGAEHLHLAALMNGRGVVVVTDGAGTPNKSIALHVRRTIFRNITTKDWDGKHVAGKKRSFDGVLLEPPSSGVGTWRSKPETRWLLRAETRARLPKEQRELLAIAAEGVRPGGFLVYAVPTLTTEETTGVIAHFLKEQPEFHVDPFPHPLEGGVTSGQLHLYPSATASDGWFIAALMRRAGSGAQATEA